jgi:hypothetical protein
LFGKAPSSNAQETTTETGDTFTKGAGLPKPDTTVRDVLDAARLASQLSPNEPFSPAGVFAMPHLVLTTPLIREPLTLNGQDVLALLVYMQQQTKENPVELSASATLGRLLDPFEERSTKPLDDALETLRRAEFLTRDDGDLKLTRQAQIYLAAMENAEDLEQAPWLNTAPWGEEEAWKTSPSLNALEGKGKQVYTAILNRNGMLKLSGNALLKMIAHLRDQATEKNTDTTLTLRDLNRLIDPLSGLQHFSSKLHKGLTQLSEGHCIKLTWNFQSDNNKVELTPLGQRMLALHAKRQTAPSALTSTQLHPEEQPYRQRLKALQILLSSTHSGGRAIDTSTPSSAGLHTSTGISGWRVFEVLASREEKRFALLKRWFPGMGETTLLKRLGGGDQKGVRTVLEGLEKTGLVTLIQPGVWTSGPYAKQYLEEGDPAYSTTLSDNILFDLIQAEADGYEARKASLIQRQQTTEKEHHILAQSFSILEREYKEASSQAIQTYDDYQKALTEAETSKQQKQALETEALEKANRAERLKSQMEREARLLAFSETTLTQHRTQTHKHLEQVEKTIQRLQEAQFQLKAKTMTSRILGVSDNPDEADRTVNDRILTLLGTIRQDFESTEAMLNDETRKTAIEAQRLMSRFDLQSRIDALRSEPSSLKAEGDMSALKTDLDPGTSEATSQAQP